MLPSLHRLPLATTGADDDESELVEAVGGLQLTDLPNDMLDHIKKLLLEGIADPKEVAKLACKDVLRWCNSHRAACNDPAVFGNALALFGLRMDTLQEVPFPNWTIQRTFRALCFLWDNTQWWFAPELATQGLRVRNLRFRLKSAIPSMRIQDPLVPGGNLGANRASMIIGASMTNTGLWYAIVNTMDFQLRHRLRQPSCPLRDLYWARSCSEQHTDQYEKYVFDWWIGNRIRAKCAELGLTFDPEIYSDTQQYNRWLAQDRALQNAVFSIDDAYWNENAWATHDGWATVRRLLNEGANPFWDPKPIPDGGNGQGGEAPQNDDRDSVFQYALKNATRDAVLEGEEFFSLLDAILDVAGGHVVQGWGLTVWNYSVHDDRALMAFTLDMWHRPGVPSAYVRLRTLEILNDLLSDGAEMLYELARGEFGNRQTPYRIVYYCHVNDQGERDCTHAESAGPIQWLVRRLYTTLVGMEARWPLEFHVHAGGMMDAPAALVQVWQTLADEMLPQYEAVVAKVRAIEAQAYQTWQANAPQPDNP